MSSVTGSRPALDITVPALLVKSGRYPYHHGVLGVVRTLGRAGVPTYATTEDRFTPVAWSRYLAGRIPPPAGNLLEHLLTIGEQLTARGPAPVAIPTDDTAAVLLAENAPQLRRSFRLPDVEATLPRRLANKRSLDEMCRRYGIPTPRTACPTSTEELRAQARTLGYPLVAKNVEPWGEAQLVKCTTVIHDETELRRRFDDAPSLEGLLLQEYIPHEESEDWFVTFVGDAQAQPVVTFVGRKERAWPPRTGVTADGRATPNPTLAELSRHLARSIGWQGIASLDWRRDLRDDRYLLVDFNVRVGAQFRFGQSVDGLDVVRALHLTLTGRPVPPAPQDFRRRVTIGNLLLPARIGERVAHLPPPPPVPKATRTERAWLAADDPVPGLVMLARGGRSVAAAVADNWLVSGWRGAARRRHRVAR